MLVLESVPPVVYEFYWDLLCSSWVVNNVSVSRLYRAVGPGFDVSGFTPKGVKVISCLLMYKH